jgi:hypothetical protein
MTTIRHTYPPAAGSRSPLRGEFAFYLNRTESPIDLDGSVLDARGVAIRQGDTWLS